MKQSVKINNEIKILRERLSYLKNVVEVRDKSLKEASELLRAYAPFLKREQIYVPPGKKLISRRASWTLIKS